MALGLDSADIEHSILLDFYTPSRRPSETCQNRVLEEEARRY